MGMGRWSRPKAQGEAPSDRCDPAAISQLTVMGQLNLMHENKNRISCHHTRQTEIYTKDEKLSPIQHTEVRKKRNKNGRQWYGCNWPLKMFVSFSLPTCNCMPANKSVHTLLYSTVCVYVYVCIKIIRALLQILTAAP